MGKSPIYQSANRRAWEDTKRSFHSIMFFWGVEVAVVSVFIYLATIFTPEDSSRFVSAGYPAVGAIIGAIVGFAIVFLILLFVAPYKQRNEARALVFAKPKPIPLQNRNELKGAIVLAENATIKLVNQQDVLDEVKAQSPHIINADAMLERDKAYANFNDAMNELRRQYLVAGEAYESICIEFTGFIWMQIGSKMGVITPPKDSKSIILENTLQFCGALAGRVKETLRKIDWLSGQVPDKEGSQT